MHRSLRNLASIALTIAMAIAAPPAHACRINLPPKERLASGYAKGVISAAALVRISRAHYSGEKYADAYPWQASATVRRVLHGVYPARVVRFARGYGSAACEDGSPAPRVGEQWIIYFWNPGNGDQRVWQSYPAKVAFEADPRSATQAALRDAGRM
jgi:hypothetical protein